MYYYDVSKRNMQSSHNKPGCHTCSLSFIVHWHAISDVCHRNKYSRRWQKENKNISTSHGIFALMTSELPRVFRPICLLRYRYKWPCIDIELPKLDVKKGSGVRSGKLVFYTETCVYIYLKRHVVKFYCECTWLYMNVRRIWRICLTTVWSMKVVTRTVNQSTNHIASVEAVQPHALMCIASSHNTVFTVDMKLR